MLSLKLRKTQGSAWGSEIYVATAPLAITIASAGPDRVWRTSDDFVYYPQKYGREILRGRAAVNVMRKAILPGEEALYTP